MQRSFERAHPLLDAEIGDDGHVIGTQRYGSRAVYQDESARLANDLLDRCLLAPKHAEPPLMPPESHVHAFDGVPPPLPQPVPSPGPQRPVYSPPGYDPLQAPDEPEGHQKTGRAFAAVRHTQTVAFPKWGIDLPERDGPSGHTR